jgi:hypothetical protein
MARTDKRGKAKLECGLSHTNEELESIPDFFGNVYLRQPI